MSNISFPPSIADFTLDFGNAFSCVKDEFSNANSSTQRALILEIYVKSMNVVLGGVAENKRADFVDAFRKSYNMLLIIEARKGDQIDPEIMEMITSREVLAGRMDENDELRVMAVNFSNEIKSNRKRELTGPSSLTQNNKTSRSWLPWRR